MQTKRTNKGVQLAVASHLHIHNFTLLDDNQEILYSSAHLRVKAPARRLSPPLERECDSRLEYGFSCHLMLHYLELVLSPFYSDDNDTEKHSSRVFFVSFFVYLFVCIFIKSTHSVTILSPKYRLPRQYVSYVHLTEPIWCVGTTRLLRLMGPKHTYF